MTVFHVMK